MILVCYNGFIIIELCLALFEDAIDTIFFKCNYSTYKRETIIIFIP